MINTFFKFLKIRKRRIRKNLEFFIFILNKIKNQLLILIEKISPNIVLSYRLRSINELQGQKFILSSESESTISPPCFKKKEIIKSYYKEISAFLIKEGVFSPFYSSLVKGNNIYLDPLVLGNPKKIGVPTGGLFVRRKPFIDDINFSRNNVCGDLRVINFKVKKRKTIEHGILIGGDGSHNWYHWIIECLPKLFLSNSLPNNFDDYPLIVPDICKKNKNFKDSLDMFNLKGREILYFGIKDIIFGKNIIYIEAGAKCPFNVKSGFQVSAQDYFHNDNLILKYADQIQKFYKREKLLIDLNPDKKVFLARKNSIRNYNQDEISKIARKYKFKEFYLEDLDLLEQFSLFSQSKYIVGPSGAAWTGLIFAKNNKLKCLSWLPDYLNQASNYSNLANLLNHDLKFIKIDDKFNNDIDYNFHCDFYTLNPDLFERELKKLILN